MDLDFTEEQETMREMVRRVCNEHAPLDVVRRAIKVGSLGFFVFQIKGLGPMPHKNPMANASRNEATDLV